MSGRHRFKFYHNYKKKKKKKDFCVGEIDKNEIEWCPLQTFFRRLLENFKFQGGHLGKPFNL